MAARGLFMVVTAIIIIHANKLKGWKKYMPLLASFWFPETMLLAFTKQISFLQLVLSGVYSALAFALLGFSLIAASNEVVERRALV
jgi:hypothetical protein